MSCRGWGHLIAATCWVPSDSSRLVWSASSKSPGSFVIQLYVTTSRCFGVSEEATKDSRRPFFAPSGCAQRDFPFFAPLICMFAGQRGAFCINMAQKSFIWVRSVFELRLMFVGRLWWSVVVDHCHCWSGAPCHIWQQSDMVIQSWGYEWLGVGSLVQTDSINSPVFCAGVGSRAPAGGWQDISAGAQSWASINPPHAVFMYFKATFLLIKSKRRKTEQSYSTCQFRFLLQHHYPKVVITPLYFKFPHFHPPSDSCSFVKVDQITESWLPRTTRSLHITCFSFFTHQFPRDVFCSTRLASLRGPGPLHVLAGRPFAIISFLPFRG